MQDKENQNEKRTADAAEKALARPGKHGRHDANVDANGHCILTQDGEMSRPNSGAPCDEGTGE